MNDKDTADRIIEEILAIPQDRRAEVISSIKYNNIFCMECGYGSRECPNRNCQCGNDD